MEVLTIYKGESMSGLGGVIIRMFRLVDKKWRPHCWFNETYDQSKPCDGTLGEPKSRCCKECPFRRGYFGKNM